MFTLICWRRNGGSGGELVAVMVKEREGWWFWWKKTQKTRRWRDDERHKRETMRNGCYWLQRGGEIVGGSEKVRVFCRRDEREKR
jgi:hypothetical protein